MKSTRSARIVLVTTPDLKTARQLARAALEARLIACVNLVRGIESHYWWQGKMDSGREVLLVMKTVTRRTRALEKLVLSLHPYDTPEFVVVPICAGADRYLDWLESSVRHAPSQPG